MGCDKHEWRIDNSRLVEGCIATKCIKCGTIGCGCSVLTDTDGKLPVNFFQDTEAE